MHMVFALHVQQEQQSASVIIACRGQKILALDRYALFAPQADIVDRRVGGLETQLQVSLTAARGGGVV